MALDKRQLRCADHVNNQGLAPHGFYKPACLEEADILRLHSQQFRAAVIGRQIIEQHTIRNKHRTENKGLIV